MWSVSIRHFMLGLASALLLVSASLDSAAGIHIAVMPDTVVVAPGDTFTVRLDITEAGSSFNGYDATVEFDPLALGFLQQPRSLQEGPLLRDRCGTFYSFSAAADSASITNILLCAGGSVTGPGTLLYLRFVALGPAGVTSINLRRCFFYDDGLYVNPVDRSNAIVTVGGALAVPTPPGAAPGMRLTAAPNPTRGECLLSAEGASRGPATLAIVDAAGRRIRRIECVMPGIVPWDGRDDSGHAVPPGVYHAILRARAGTSTVTLIRLR